MAGASRGRREPIELGIYVRTTAAGHERLEIGFRDAQGTQRGGVARDGYAG